MKRRPLPEAVRLIADDNEWGEFQAWQAQPKPTIMLDRNGRFPDVPHELADDLFGRVVERLKEGVFVAFGRWGQRVHFEEIDPLHWATMDYNIWFNELGYADGGRVGFSSICVEQSSEAKPVQAKPQTRTAVKRYLDDWLEANPNSQITRPDMLREVRTALSVSHIVTENLFNGVWHSGFPDGNKFEGRPPG